jgi:hypothetical protein
MTSKQLRISFSRPSSNCVAALAGAADRKPMFDPLSECHFVRGNVMASVCGVQQVPQSLLSLRLCTLDSFCVAPSVNAVPEAPSIFAPGINATVTMATFVRSNDAAAHGTAPLIRMFAITI